MDIEIKRRVLTLTLNRLEKGNSLDPQALIDMRAAMLDAQSNNKIHLIVIMGAGEKDFCTGIDINAARDLSPENKTNIANIAGDIATLIYSGKPTIVTLNGRTMGMGVVFATAADYCIAREGIELKMPEVNVGIFPGASCIVQMTRICGINWTRKILMSGNSFTAQDAIDANIVNEIVPFENFSQKIKEITRSYTKKNPVLLKAIKQSILFSREINYSKGIELEINYSQYYNWEDPEKEVEHIMSKYEIDFPLTGNPELLIEEISHKNKEQYG